MPETSQDAFEKMFPAKQPISPEELRNRSNSMNKGQPMIRIDNTLVAAESNFWPPAAMNAPNYNIGRGPREARVSVGDFDSCITGSTDSQYHGYKRESRHR